MTLKELASKYTNIQIFDEISNTYALNRDDYIASFRLLKVIRSSPVEKNDEKTIDFYVLFLKKKEFPALITYAGFNKNGRMYKFNHKNTADLLSIAGCEVNIDYDDDFGMSTAQTELQQFIAVLLSLTAFSDAAVDYYFDGDKTSVLPELYLKYLYDSKQEEGN